MQIFFDFIKNNYIWVLIGILILIFILIGYVVDVARPKEVKKKKKFKTIDNVFDDNQEVHPSIEKYTDDQFDDPLIK